MKMKSLLATLCTIVAFSGASALAQFPPQGDDVTTSIGSFRIRIADNFTNLFANCPAYNPTTKVFQSPNLYDPATLIGRSSAIVDGGPQDLAGVPVGSAGTTVMETMLIPPPGFGFGAGTREVHTEVRSLKMTATTPGGTARVRGGVWYNDPTTASPPTRVSPGEVESKSGPSNNPALDFPASSYFDIFVRVDVPACGKFPGATVYNLLPLIVKNNQVTQFPPRVVYLHDSSSVVPVLFLTASPLWTNDAVLGYFVLVGHGVGFSNSDADQNEFNNFMGGQSDAQCPFCPTPVCPPPSPSPTPVPSPSPTPTATPLTKTNSARTTTGGSALKGARH
jgi:hypothetical protein